MDVILDSSLPASGFLAKREPYLPYWERAQWKSVYRLFRRFRFEIPYDRFKRICLFSDPRRSEQEEEIFEVATWYIDALRNIDRNLLLIGSTRQLPPFPEADLSRPLIEICQKAIAWATNLSDDPTIFALLIDICLFGMGLWPSVHRYAEDFDFNNPSDVALCLLKTPKLEKEIAAKMTLLSLNDILDRLPKILCRFGLEKVYLYGSHLDGTQSRGSDIDLLVVIESGHSMEEKAALMTALKDGGQVSC